MADSRLEDYYYLRVSGRVNINGKDYPLLFFSVTYAIDTIPTAMIGMPIGKNASTGSISAAEGLISTLEPFTPIDVYVTIKPFDRAAPPGKSQGFPSGEFKVFTGYVAMPGMRKSFDSSTASLVVGAFGIAGGFGGTTQYTRGMTSPNPMGIGPAITAVGNRTAEYFDKGIEKAFGDQFKEDCAKGILNMFNTIAAETVALSAGSNADASNMPPAFTNAYNRLSALLLVR